MTRGYFSFAKQMEDQINALSDHVVTWVSGGLTFFMENWETASAGEKALIIAKANSNGFEFDREE